MTNQFRTEKDSMGEIQVPADKLWGAQTARSMVNFPIGPAASMPLEIVYAFGFLKKAAAVANAELGVLDKEKAEIISTVCEEIIEGRLDEHFPLVIWQTGSGTQTNMNINEVISNRVQQIRGEQLGAGTLFVHPNDDVNRSQSSNDTFPTAMHIAALKKLEEKCLPGLEKLMSSLLTKEEEFKDIIKIGRTHWMDATPLTLGQEFSGYVSMLKSGIEALRQSVEPLRELALGGTAVGTGINCPKGYDKRVAELISQFTGLPFVTAKNKFAALAAHDPMVRSHAALKQISVTLTKIGNDIRRLASGPRAGLGELQLPENEPGSSIMPGKVNPTQVEALTMVCAQVIGNDVAMTIGGASGQFELNVYKPLLIANFLQSAELLGDVCSSFSKRCVSGIRPNRQVIQDNLERSLMLVTALTPHVGYDKAAVIAKNAHKNGTTLKEEILKELNVSPSEVDEWLQPDKMI